MPTSSDRERLPAAPRRHGGQVPVVRRPRTLSREAVLTAAMAIVDSEGLDALTMRRLARALDTGAASLYAHVASKEEVVAAVLDRVVAEVDVTAEIVADRWQEQLKDLLRGLRLAYHRHGDIARAGLGTIPTGEGALTAEDHLLGVLLAGGVEDRVAALSVDLLFQFVTSSVVEDTVVVAPEVDQSNPAYIEQLRDFLAALPPGRFPHLVALAGPLTAGDGDERFEFGLDLLVRGIVATKGASPS